MIVMKWGIIATWRMAYEGIDEAAELLKSGKDAADSVETAVKRVEDYPYYKSVGYGGLPNECCDVELDAAFMDGDDLSIGAVAGMRDFANPVSVARSLSKDRFNIFLVGAGAEAYAHQAGFERKNMLTERAKKLWKKRVKEITEKNLSPYDGHDTVGMICLDQSGKMTAATSTSGLFMKKRGRVGDSPLSGSGFYVDSQIGGATATGLGEDIMKGCLSYEAVKRMEEGRTPQQAADEALAALVLKLEKKRGKAGAMSIVCMNKDGDWGVGTNVEFSFAVATERQSAKIYIAYPKGDGCCYEEASREWLDAYQKRITSPIED